MKRLSSYMTEHLNFRSVKESCSALDGCDECDFSNQQECEGDNWSDTQECGGGNCDEDEDLADFKECAGVKESVVNFSNRLVCEGDNWSDAIAINEGEITSEEEFRSFAEDKFKKAFGDKLDKDQMKKTIEGIIEKAKGDWGTAIGMLNKSFGG